MNNPQWITTEEFENEIINDVFKRTMNIIASKPDKHANSHVLFRKTVIIEDASNLKIRISADDYYRLFINEKIVSIGPASCYYFHQYYNEIDVSKYFKKGLNVISVDTYYQGLVNRVWVSGDYRHGLYFGLYKDDDLILPSDESWKAKISDAYITNDNIYGWITQFSENVDFNSKDYNFYKIDYDDSHFGNARIKKNQDWVLYKNDTKPLDIYIYNDYKKNIKNDNRIYLDLGQEIVGYVYLKARGIKNSEVIIHQAEELNEDGSLRYDIRANCLYEEKAILSGNIDTLYQYEYKGFRYVEILFDSNTDIIDYKVVVRHYPFKEINKFELDDHELKRIYDLCKNTIKYSTQEQFLDCPTREKGQYFGDGVYIALSHYLLTKDPSITYKMIDNAFESTKIEKTMMAYGPASRMDEIAEYPLMIVWLVYLMFKLTSDVTILDKYYKASKELVSVYRDRYVLENGLINVYDKWNVLDWPESKRDGYDMVLKGGIPVDKPHNVMNAYYYLAIDSVSKMEDTLNIKRTFDVDGFKRSYINAFYDENKRLYKDHATSSNCSIGSNVFPLFLGFVNDKTTKENIIKMIENKKMDYSNLFISPFVLFSLVKVGKYKKALELIKDENYWMNMIKEGATTTFEAFSKEFKYNTSLCHPSFAFPIIFMNEEYVKRIVE